ncbi:MAG TPA: glycosyltransferase family 4 protein, partial [Verrucomicrobiae bacterium]|nr:glycosyltransferase family 4 protein [Verrucomicrobiae bacterium]
CGGSDGPGKFIETLPGPYGVKGSFDDWELCEWVNLCRAVEQSGNFDVLHTHAYLWGIPLEKFSRAPLVHTLHIVPDHNTWRLWSLSPESHVTAISNHQWSGHPELRPCAVIPHGVDVAQFTFQPRPDDYLCYLGRFVSGKGPIQAIKAAQALGLRLVMAGPESPYFREKVKPLIDGRSVEYAGFIRGSERNKLLGGARALIYPIQYPEAFGLVLLEAMLCGTPVAAMRLGAVPEIVDEGVTGYSANSPEDFLRAIKRALQLDRQVVRQRAEERYSAQQMAREYAAVYERISKGSRL